MCDMNYSLNTLADSKIPFILLFTQTILTLCIYFEVKLVIKQKQSFQPSRNACNQVLDNLDQIEIAYSSQRQLNKQNKTYNIVQEIIQIFWLLQIQMQFCNLLSLIDSFSQFH
ncbi:hypothetical protein ABPG72_004993 [Tetrahymena utriculariae]